VFSTLSFWVSFVPVLASVGVDQVFDHVKHTVALRRRIAVTEAQLAALQGQRSSERHVRPQESVSNRSRFTAPR
jgi:hypothetical protein